MFGVKKTIDHILHWFKNQNLLQKLLTFSLTIVENIIFQVLKYSENANSNTDLFEWFYCTVGKLIEKNILIVIRKI